MRARWSAYRAVIAVAVIGISLVGCSSTGGKPAATGGGNSAGTADTPRIKIAMVTHAQVGDTFWDTVRKGAEMAAAKDNVELTYQGAEQAPEQANAIQSAIDSKVDGIAVTLAKPDAMEPAVAAAAKAGIPVIAFNAGFDAWKTQDVLGYIGTDEQASGRAVGERLNSEGAKNVVCVNHAQGHVDLEARCAGIAQTFKGRSEILYVNGNDMPAAQATMTAKLQQDPSIDYLVTLDAPFAMTAFNTASSAGSKAKVGTFGTDNEVTKSIQANGVQWAIDIQPYLQGYLAVDSLWLYLTNRNVIGGGQPVLTGPAFIDAKNVASIAEYAAKGTR
ncbi:substrate-binding domain-containing protein [Mycolicibacterium cosmeticum]|uniref:substrate-binding domain-containing protein n=1 Tax=Mycolicibacterium cosmeticum TaxID=258533 RepID=UPI003204C804